MQPKETSGKLSQKSTQIIGAARQAEPVAPPLLKVKHRSKVICTALGEGDKAVPHEMILKDPFAPPVASNASLVGWRQTHNGLALLSWMLGSVTASVLLYTPLPDWTKSDTNDDVELESELVVVWLLLVLLLLFTFMSDIWVHMDSLRYISTSASRVHFASVNSLTCAVSFWTLACNILFSSRAEVS